MMRVKNWGRFQHYRKRRPPWIKLHRELLDDQDWHLLNPLAAKTLVLLWLIASESDGELPDATELAFRLRTTEERVTKVLAQLEHWLVSDASATLAPRKQDSLSETEAEAETEAEKSREETPPPAATLTAFDEFWKSYPRKVGKGDARRAWAKAKLDGKLAVILAAVVRQKGADQWRKDGGQFIPNPATWLRQERWEDEGIEAPAAAPPPPRREDPRMQHERAVREIDLAIRQAESTAVAPEDVDRAVAALRDKYRDQPAVLKEALEIWRFRILRRGQANEA